MHPSALCSQKTGSRMLLPVLIVARDSSVSLLPMAAHSRKMFDRLSLRNFAIGFFVIVYPHFGIVWVWMTVVDCCRTFGPVGGRRRGPGGCLIDCDLGPGEPCYQGRDGAPLFLLLSLIIYLLDTFELIRYY